MTRYLSFVFPFLCLILSLLFPEACTEGVKKGLTLSLDRALPALFPALVLSALLPALWPAKGRRSLLVLPLFAGLFCGFPVGSTAVRELKEKGVLDQKEGERMLLFANNAGPAFLLSYCGGQVLKNEKAALFLFLAQSALAMVLFGIFFGKSKGKRASLPPSQTPQRLGIALPAALRSGANSFLYVMSCVIFFSFLSALAQRLIPALGVPLSLFLEITGGVGALAALPFSRAFPLCALACGWGGLSVLMQTACVLEGSGLRLRFHVFGRMIFAAFLFLSTPFFEKVL